MTDYVTPAEQAMNLIRYIGDEVKRMGQHLNITYPEIPDIMGAQNHELAEGIIKELQEKGLILIAQHERTVADEYTLESVTLSLDGWEQYEEEQRGKFAGNYGFLAMEFDDPEHETFAQEVLKPAVEMGTGFELHDQRDKSKAGIIDNLLRVNVRDARFVIVDLTHDNRGAYWEAGYAEGLGKPVVYICTKEKFDEAGTHFDTNHLTTVQWSSGEEEAFCQNLVATLRRSLDPEGGH